MALPHYKLGVLTSHCGFEVATIGVLPLKKKKKIPLTTPFLVAVCVLFYT